MTLTENRILFTTFLGRLLTWATDVSGIIVAVDEVKRGIQQAQYNAQHGLGIIDSLHTLGLAADLLVYQQVQGALVYCDKGTEPGYALLGHQWERMDPRLRWGGRFSHPDWDHFSIGFEGRQ